MAEVQSHGFKFQNWVIDTLFNGCRSGYTLEWDVPPNQSCHPNLPPAFRGLPVSIKTAKYGSPIGLGDILRQRQIAQPFLMIVGFWTQRTRREKWFEDIGCAYFSVADWCALWGDLELGVIQPIDRVVKEHATPYTTVRIKTREWKRDTPEVATSRIVVNPKIDSKSQRRIQCSLPFGEFWKQVGRQPERHDRPNLFGFEFPNPVVSNPRTFRVD